MTTVQHFMIGLGCFLLGVSVENLFDKLEQNAGEKAPSHASARDFEELRQTVEQQARTLEEHRSWISDVRTFVIDADKTARSADSRVKDIEIRMGIRQAAPGSPEQCDEPQPTLADPPKPPAKEPEKPKPDEPAPKTLPTPTYTNRYRNNRMR